MGNKSLEAQEEVFFNEERVRKVGEK